MMLPERPVIEFLYPDRDQYHGPELCKVRDSDHIEPVHQKQRSGKNQQERQNQLTGLGQMHLSYASILMLKTLGRRGIRFSANAGFQPVNADYSMA
jgi:hypothetical protein